MRIHFQNASIPTRAANRLKYRLSLKESQARQVTSEVFGYRDWTDLHSELGSTAASALDEGCDSATLSERRAYQASQLAASSVDLHGASADDFVQWWQPSAAHPHEEDARPAETPFAGSKEDLSFQEALSTLAHAVHHPVGHFEQALVTGIRRTENETSLSLAEAITDELLSGNRNREPEVARHLLEALASRGLPRSILNLSTSLALGDGGPKDEKRAAGLLAQLADSASTPDDLKRIAKSRLGTAQAHGNPQPAS
ncbi:hypothetical protein BGLT_02182 [Caballeronia glathei]|uniref:Uncharacterized protein n=1 Tax=Caballeronia glathei TaxID=60547 RepID=A0A069PG52_9BURK|nr:MULTISPECIES: hypothetical protein [Burkholderiaceae]KDR39482.1 hypothetical protein BG61_31875 [Caballeronia glathei]TCK38790.1 hypothetical protein B0G84_4111 [Paraburkholderia sp. BL8N3]CDY79401.1 hypothetical protein BGLT_02182 [Caballeronia glathei]